MSYFTKLPSETVGGEQIVCNECGYVSRSVGEENKHLKEHLSKYHPETMLKYIHKLDAYQSKIYFTYVYGHLPVEYRLLVYP